MKYNSQEQKLHFTSEAQVRLFHDQLTELVRYAMSRIGTDNMSDGELKEITQDFFEKNSELLLALKCLRVHLPREENGY